MQIEIPEELAAAVAEIARTTGQDVQSLVSEMVTEAIKMAIKMRRVRGIVFADGPTGRRAQVGGTGIEVFEVIQAYVAGGCDRDDLRKVFHWLNAYQLNMAVAYYEAFPEDIKPYLRTEEEEIAAIEALWREIPQTSPYWPGRRPGEQGPMQTSPRESA
jgi:uncharacterized protein (DUF433 family)